MNHLMKDRITGPTKLRELIDENEILLAPGAYDALSARIIESVGFPVVFITGFGSAASMLGYPDVGLTTLSEMVDNARRIVNSVNIPVIVDADTGYGNQINVIRAVQDFERAGVAGIQLEDQVFPKKCGFIEGKQIIPKDEFVQKIRAAKAAARDKDLLIIARTDAVSVEGLESAIDRAKMCYSAGADIIFVNAPKQMDQLEELSRQLREIPLIYNWSESGKSPQIDIDTLKHMGFNIILFPSTAFLSATRAMKESLESIKSNGTPENIMDKLYPFDDFLNLIGLPEVKELERKFGVDQ